MASSHIENERTSTNNSHQATRISLNIRTLDQKNYLVSILSDASVPQLKEMVASKTGIVIGRQRLIFRGKVLKNDQNIAQYALKDGHTLHLVTRAENLEGDVSGSAAVDNSNLPDARSNDEPDTSMGNTLPSNRLLIGATITVPEGSDLSMPLLSSMISNIVNSVQGAGVHDGRILFAESERPGGETGLPSPPISASEVDRQNAFMRRHQLRRAVRLERTRDRSRPTRQSRIERLFDDIRSDLNNTVFDFPNLIEQQSENPPSSDADIDFLREQTARMDILLRRFLDRLPSLPQALNISWIVYAKQWIN